MSHPHLHAAATPEKHAYVMAGSGAVLSFAALEAQSNQSAHLLRACGAQTGDHLALLMENCLEFMTICWAAQRSGIYYTPISRFLKPAEIAFIIADSGARILIVSPATLAGLDISQFPPGLVFTTGPAQPGVRSWTQEAAQQPATQIADQAQGADMLYSSGTTGRPKGVKPPRRDAPIETLHPLLKVLGCDMIGMDRDTVYLSPAPLYHAAPLRFTMLAAAIGATTIIMEKFDPEIFLDLVAAHRVTHTQCVPTMFVRLLKLPAERRQAADISSLRGAVHAASPCPPDIKQAMIDWWGPVINEYYGATEIGSVVFCTAADWLSHPGTVGRALPGVDLRVFDENGAECPAGVPGDVHARILAATDFTYHGDDAKRRNAERNGLISVGDIGYLDEDGFLYLCDRRTDMVISGGVNIYPAEIESALVQLPEVADCAVFGIPDDELGEILLACVQPAFDTDPDEAAIRTQLRARLAGYKVPKKFVFLDQLPREDSGKIFKRRLREPYWAGRERRI
jgi:acyl-CoA synthetase (AMP-forming)/AMP-acid ligase II